MVLYRVPTPTKPCLGWVAQAVILPAIAPADGRGRAGWARGWRWEGPPMVTLGEGEMRCRAAGEANGRKRGWSKEDSNERVDLGVL